MACDPKLINRLKRAEGQLRGIQAMMTEGGIVLKSLPS